MCCTHTHTRATGQMHARGYELGGEKKTSPNGTDMLLLGNGGRAAARCKLAGFVSDGERLLPSTTWQVAGPKPYLQRRSFTHLAGTVFLCGKKRCCLHTTVSLYRGRIILQLRVLWYSLGTAKTLHLHGEYYLHQGSLRIKVK